MTSELVGNYGLEPNMDMQSEDELVEVPLDEQESPPVTTDDIHKLFSPYQRISPQWSVYEVVKSFIVAIIILPLRLIYLALGIGILLLLATFATVGLKENHDSERAAEAEEIPSLEPLSSWRKCLLFLLFPIIRSILFISFGVYHIKTEQKSFSRKEVDETLSTDACVVVANHLGYIDGLVLLCNFHCSFVMKGDLENSFLVGKLARALQFMSVRRGESLTLPLIRRVRSTENCRRNHEGAESRRCQRMLAIFPEGTTTNGTAMVPFRTGVFTAGVPVKPVCIRLPYSHFNLSWESVCFREHLFRTMTQLVNYVHITELPIYVPSEEEKNDARLYAFNVQQEFSGALEQPIVPLNRKHKLLYHSYILGREQDEQEVLRKSEEISRLDNQLSYISKRNIEEMA